MKIMLDCSPRKIHEYRERYGEDFLQLRTPLTQNKLAGVQYGLDNGCFTTFNKKVWLRLLEDAKTNTPQFVCLPDAVGDARRTQELFNLFEHDTYGLPRALVLQDGIGSIDIEWQKVSAVFVGGSNDFKLSNEAMAACKTAKILGKWVHVGRVNTYERALYWKDVADSCDGSGLSRYDHMLENVLAALNGEPKPIRMARRPQDPQLDIFG